jgi:hypothetical protein
MWAASATFGPVDLFVAGAGFDVAGAVLLASGLTTSTERAAGRLIQSRNSFARFDVRTAEDYADGWLGRSSLIVGFAIQAVAYAWSAHGVPALSGSRSTYLWLAIFGAGAIALVYVVAKFLRPRIRNKWLVEFARIDNYGYRHPDPSGRELMESGQVLGFRCYQAEFSDIAAYARRVFNVETVRDSSQDHLTRPANFQPNAALDDPHGYVVKNPRRWWQLRP